MGLCCSSPSGDAYSEDIKKGNKNSILIESTTFMEKSKKNMLESYAGDDMAEKSMFKIDKDHMARGCNLNMHAGSLKVIFERLDMINNKDLVLCLSPSKFGEKVGRSTFLSYLAFGAD